MPRTVTRREALTAERILDVAERLVQTRGVNSVSYANIAAEVGITHRRPLLPLSWEG